MRARFPTMAGVDAMQLKTLFDRMRDEMRTDANHAAHSEGALMVYEKQLAKLSRHCAQTRAMLDAYNK